MDSRITVPQVARVMGVVLDKRTSWAVGSDMASKYLLEFGENPPKDNRPKTNGSGSHCFALYPAKWEKKIRSVIEAHLEQQAKQNDLFVE